MRNRFIYILSGIFILSGAFVSCQEDMETFDNKAFVFDTNKVNTLLLKSNVDAEEKILHAAIAKPVGNEIRLTYRGDASLVDQYNAAYYDQALALPAECYEIPDPIAVIGAGSVKSTEVKVLFKNLKSLDFEKVYVLPVTIADATIDILQSARTTYFVFKGSALINVVADINENNVYVDWVNPDVVNNLGELTAEILIKPNTFDHAISTIMGIEGKFLIRTGDSEPKDQIQIATSGGNVTDASWKINTKEWTHLAITYNASNGEIKVYFNGVQKGETYHKTIGYIHWGEEHSDESNGKPRCFWIGYSYDSGRYLDGEISECRIWNRVLTTEEIGAKDHFYTVNPLSDGLVAYWKFDDGVGNSIKDHTLNGNHATSSATLKWNAVELPVK